ncbi:MAG: putative sugar nucleotidyl transferase [Phycisphaerales bacterium]
MARLIVFDDGGALLGPLTDLRASFEVRTGAATTLERWSAWSEDGVAGLFVPVSRGLLADVARERHGLPVNDGGAVRGEMLCVNGRCVLPLDEALELKAGQALVDGDGAVMCARLGEKDAKAFLSTGALSAGVKRATVGSALVLSRPWDVIRHRDSALAWDLEVLAGRESQELPPGVMAIGEEDIFISPEAEVYPSVVLDAECGKIVIDDEAVVRPGAVIVGPAYVGKKSYIAEQSLIKAKTAIGPVCKVGGEVGGTIFQGFANKVHDGHLGDSWVGEWVNLGAATVNSNLLNTYGEVTSKATHDGKTERTGLRYLGAIIGDHAKTAIGTRIMTGCVIGMGAMMAGSAGVSGAVKPFAWITDPPAGERAYRLNKFMDVMRAVMARRELKPSAAYEALIGEMHARVGA